MLFSLILQAQDDSDQRLLKLVEYQLETEAVSFNDVLSNSSYESLLINPKLRVKLRNSLLKYPAFYQLIMVTPNETGERLIIYGKLVNPKPSSLIYFFQTDNNGLYAPEHERPGAGSNNPRLFGYIQPNEKGEFIINTIVPSCYPGGSLKHIHYQIINGNSVTDGELIFDEEPYPPNDRQRSWARRVGFKIVKKEWDDQENSYVLRVEIK